MAKSNKNDQLLDKVEQNILICRGECKRRNGIWMAHGMACGMANFRDIFSRQFKT
jgi:hypothetical protein